MFSVVYDFQRDWRSRLSETEIIEGDENTLVMIQTYTEEFQCQYMLQHYPFDTQAKMLVLT